MAVNGLRVNKNKNSYFLLSNKKFKTNLSAFS